MSDDAGRQRVVQIACGSFITEDGFGAHTLYALTEDGRIYANVSDAGWEEEEPIPSGLRPKQRGRSDG